MHRSWPAYPRRLAALRAEVRRWLAPLALPGDAKNDLLLAVNEAASNCVEHAYTPATVDGTVELTFWTEPRSVCVEIVDHGAWRIPCGQSTGRGRGIAIMQRLIPVVLIHYDNRGTRVLLSHPLPGPVRGGSRRGPGRRRDGGAVGVGSGRGGAVEMVGEAGSARTAAHRGAGAAAESGAVRDVAVREPAPTAHP